jgi:hypothetical protein
MNIESKRLRSTTPSLRKSVLDKCEKRCNMTAGSKPRCSLPQETANECPQETEHEGKNSDVLICW